MYLTSRDMYPSWCNASYFGLDQPNATYTSVVVIVVLYRIMYNSVVQAVVVPRKDTKRAHLHPISAGAPLGRSKKYQIGR